MKKKQTQSILLISLLLLMLLLTACGKKTGNRGETVFTPAPTEEAASSNRIQLLAETTPIKDILTIGKYKGVEATLLKLTVTDAEVERDLHLSLADHVVDTERTTIEKYDMANINFEGKVNGETFQGGTAESYSLLIGSGRFIPGFEDGLLGATVGETIDLNLTFPETYGTASLAGKDVVFTVTVNSLKAFPELTDALIAEKTDFETLEAYKENIRTQLQNSYDAQTNSQFENDIMSAIVADASYHMDLSTEIMNYASNMQSMYEATANQYGVSLEVYLNAMFGISLSKFMEELPKSAEQVIRSYYAMLAVADAEGMTISDEVYADYTAKMMVDYGYESMEALEADYPRKNLENSILYEQAINLVMESAIKK